MKSKVHHNLTVLGLLILAVILVIVSYNRGYQQGQTEGQKIALQSMTMVKQYDKVALECIEYKYEELKRYNE